MPPLCQISLSPLQGDCHSLQALAPPRPLQSVLRAAARVNPAEHPTLFKSANTSRYSQDKDIIPLYLSQQGPPTDLVFDDFPTSFPLCTLQRHCIPCQAPLVSKLPSDSEQFPFSGTFFTPLLMNTSTSSDVSSRITSSWDARGQIPQVILLALSTSHL